MTAFHTTLPKRTRDVTRDDFVGLDKLSINGFSGGEVKYASLEHWNERIPYTPEQVYSIFSNGYSDAPAVSLDLDILTKMIVRVFGEDKTFSSMLEFHYDPNFKAANSSIVVNADHRGQGNGKNWLRTAIEFTHAMGGKRFAFTATNDNGAYTWARANAYINFNVNDFEEKRDDISKRCLARLEFIKDLLDKDDYTFIQQLCMMRNKDDFVRLAAFSSAYVPVSLSPDHNNVTTHPKYDDLVDFYDQYRPGRAAILLANSEMFRISDVFSNASFQGHEAINIGRYILSGCYWPGVYDFADQKQMNDAGAYLGGWKTLQPSSQNKNLQLTAECV
jgi:GNAT superfamily N-acetyltransferase